MIQFLIDGIFDLLKENKQYPSYQAERRIDIFINYFLRNIISEYLDESVEYVCPEFPIKKKDNNLSTKLDYLCKTKKYPVFVELKTDNSSLSIEQAEIYLKCSWQKCKSELKEIVTGVKKKEHLIKYDKLIAKIENLEFPVQDPSIRIIYISPAPKEDSKFKKNLKVLNIKNLSEFRIPIRDEEQLIWNRLVELNLSVFEITR